MALENDLGCGIREPISLDLKTNRAGLGHEKEEDKRRMERLKGEMDRMRDMTKRHKNVSNTKQFIGDILNSRKACLELDLRINLDVPKQPWFWKSYREQSEEKQNSRYNQSPLLSDHDDEDIRYFYPNGKLAEKEERFDELTDDVLEEKLEEITAYLRHQHMYCIWCGCQYSSKDELNTTCPGDTRQHHDDLQD
uniref:DUF4187 domain-containing protein n=1 Tax=Heterorhabditis bacteriophora TaxID=37862 RepID=A0A1I7WAN7_HETBA